MRWLDSIVFATGLVLLVAAFAVHVLALAVWLAGGLVLDSIVFATGLVLLVAAFAVHVLALAVWLAGGLV